MSRFGKLNTSSILINIKITDASKNMYYFYRRTTEGREILLKILYNLILKDAKHKYQSWEVEMTAVSIIFFSY